VHEFKEYEKLVNFVEARHVLGVVFFFFFLNTLSQKQGFFDRVIGLWRTDMTSLSANLKHGKREYS